jgi:hypothetical protein
VFGSSFYSSLTIFWFVLPASCLRSYDDDLGGLKGRGINGELGEVRVLSFDALFPRENMFLLGVLFQVHSTAFDQIAGVTASLFRSFSSPTRREEPVYG